MTISAPKIISGDCIERMADLAAESVNLIVTSPPYQRAGMKYGGVAGADRQTDEEWQAMMRGVLAEAARVLTADGQLWLNLGFCSGDEGERIPLTYLVFPMLAEFGLHFRQEIIWAKEFRGYPTTRAFAHNSERWMWIVKDQSNFTFRLDEIRRPVNDNKTGMVRCNPLGANPGDIWTHNRVRGHARPDHPCPYPIEMIERIIKGCSNPGDVVLDPFGGSGTTALAAMRLGRNSISIEREPEYVAVSANRLLGEQTKVIDQQAAEIARLKAELSRAKEEQQRQTSVTSDAKRVTEAVAKSTTKREVVVAMSWPVNTFSYKRLDKMCAELGISTTHFVGQGWRRKKRDDAVPIRKAA